MQPRDPHFPNLPPVSDEQYRVWTKKQKPTAIHLITEAAKLFNAMQAVGVDIFEAERVATGCGRRARPAPFPVQFAEVTNPFFAHQDLRPPRRDHM
jgi:hypothetical protein